MKKRIRLIALLVLAIIIAVLLWKFVPWAKLSTWYANFSISDLSPVWYYSTVILLAVLLMVAIWFVLQIIPKRQAQALQTPPKKVVFDGQEIDEEGSIFSPQSSLKPAELFSIENEARKTLSQIIGGFIVIVSLILTGANLAITSRLTQEGQITDRFTKAIGQLGDKDKLEVRLGGIYALERIANDSEKDHWTIMEVLTAYVRENAPVKKPGPSPKVSSNKKTAIKEEVTPEKPKTDIQAILTVIGRRKADGEKNDIELKRRQANDEKNNIDLNRTDLSKARLSGADLSGADLRGADLRGADLRGADLTWAHLFRADLRGAHLSGADLRGANLQGAKLDEADLSGAKLTVADFSEADLTGAILTEAELQVTHFRRANLTGVGFFRADLSGADLRGADLSGATLLTWKQVSFAIIDDYTKLPLEIEDQHKDELKAMREKTRE